MGISNKDMKKIVMKTKLHYHLEKYKQVSSINSGIHKELINQRASLNDQVSDIITIAKTS